LWSLAGGGKGELLRGDGSLRITYLVTLRGAVGLVLVLITLPFLLVDLVHPGDAVILPDLAHIWSIPLRSVSIMVRRLLGPPVSHVVWNKNGPKQMRMDLCRYWKEPKT